MFKKKHCIYLTQDEYRIVLNSLFYLRSTVISNGGYGDSINELIEKVYAAPLVKT